MQRVAVVGSGISGLSAAWLLRARHRVTLFEAGGYLGGHTNTVDVTLEGNTFPVDTGFLVFNERTYPNLCALFSAIGVESVASNMTFSVRVDAERVEWAGSNLATVFSQKRNMVNPEFWAMLKDIVRFNAAATQVVESGIGAEGSLDDFLTRGRYGRTFRDWYLLPMSAAIWSCPTERMLAYPASTFLRFCHNHGLLQISGRPQWRTVRGGGREYVRRLSAGLEDVRTHTPVLGVRRVAGGVEVRTSGGAERFDHAVLATHSDQALAILEDADRDERAVLSAIRYQPNTAWLHTDTALLPRSRKAWSAWNYLATEAAASGSPVAVSYLLNMLQPLPCTTPVVVTLNPVTPPRRDLVLQRFEYAHPVFDDAAVEAQRRLPAIQGRRGTWFCGAWTGYGFHEDGLKSGLAVSNALGVRAPWQAEAIAA